MSTKLRDRYSAGLRSVAETFWAEQLGTWHGLWEVASGHLGAGRWASRAARTWSRWVSPSTWLEPFLPPPDGVAASRPPIVQFVVDRAAESTPEQEIALGSRISTGGPVKVTELRHLLGEGALPSACLSALLVAGGGVLRLALVDLFGTQAKIQQGALPRGHYVGAVLAGEPPAPVAFLDIYMEG
jgi:hypothetical protein